MGKLGNGSMILAGIVLLVFGIIVASDAIDWLVTLILNVVGWGMGILGIIFLIYGLVKVFKGSSRSQSDY